MPYLTPNQKDELIEKIRSRYKKCPNGCPILGGSVQVGDLVGLPMVERAVPSGVTLSTNQFLPAVPVVCGNCGCITWFSAAGLVDFNE